MKKYSGQARRLFIIGIAGLASAFFNLAIAASEMRHDEWFFFVTNLAIGIYFGARWTVRMQCLLRGEIPQ